MKIRLEYLNKKEKEKFIECIEANYEILSESEEKSSSQRERNKYKKIFIEVQERSHE